MPVLGITLMAVYVSCSCLALQYCSQNAEKVTHIKGRLLDQAVLLFNCIPFQSGNFSKKKEFAPRGSKFFPLEQFLIEWKITFTTSDDLP